MWLSVVVCPAHSEVFVGEQVIAEVLVSEELHERCGGAVSVDMGGGLLWMVCARRVAGSGSGTCRCSGRWIGSPSE